MQRRTLQGRRLERRLPWRHSGRSGFLEVDVVLRIDLVKRCLRWLWSRYRHVVGKLENLVVRKRRPDLLRSSYLVKSVQQRVNVVLAVAGGCGRRRCGSWGEFGGRRNRFRSSGLSSRDRRWRNV